MLTRKVVEGIQLAGGTILVSSRVPALKALLFCFPHRRLVCQCRGMPVRPPVTWTGTSKDEQT